jgi:hypothetical protein
MFKLYHELKDTPRREERFTRSRVRIDEKERQNKTRRHDAKGKEVETKQNKGVIE